ncbi:hypothetical protein JCM10908_005133 [Rhodotorula pacifica]|uniref:uncharacterized protein n=1 Tax=Rhodotorula pacifica TaxID=1495444 RepID=UPI0031755424
MATTPSTDGNGDGNGVHTVLPVDDPVLEVDADDAADESQPLLSSTSSAATKTKPTRVRHGRGPIIQDDEDDDDGDDDEDTVTGGGGGVLDDPEAAAGAPHLLSHSHSHSHAHPHPHTHKKRRHCRSLTSLLCLLLGVLFLLVLLILAVLHLWIGHLLAEEQRRHHGSRDEVAEEMVRRGLIFQGPSGVRIIPPTGGDSFAGEGEGEGGVVIEVDATMGMDVRRALEWEYKDDRDHHKKDKKGGFAAWRARTEAKLVRWAVNRADHVDIAVSGVRLFADPAEPTTLSLPVNNVDDPLTTPLLELSAPIAFSLPISYPLPDDLDEPRTDSYTFTIPLLFPSPRELVEFGKKVYDEKKYRVRAEIGSVDVRVGAGMKGRKGLEKWVMDRFVSTPRGVKDLVKVVDGQLPDLPTPPQDPNEMVELVSLSVFESPAPVSSSSSPLSLLASSPSSASSSSDDDDTDLTAAAAKKQPHNDTVIAFAVSAELKNPLLDAIKNGTIPPVAWSMPFRLPIEIALPLPPSLVAEEPEIALARVSIAPFRFAEGDKKAELGVTGYVVPAGNLSASRPPSPPTRDPSDHRHAISAETTTSSTSPQAPLSRALSRFVARYLSGRSNDVFIRYDSSHGLSSASPPTIPSDPARDMPLPPRFLADLVRDQVMRVSIPGTNETPELFKDLRMEDMKVKLGGRGEGDDADLLASGRVVGEVVLPEMAQGLAEGIDAKWIWPDVLVYDGELPRSAAGLEAEDELLALGQIDSKQVVLGSAAAAAAASDLASTSYDDDDDSAAMQYPPSPIPANAFARMRPSESMTATTIHLPSNGSHPARTLVSATFVDAPLYLLPERGDVLRRFVGKIIFGGKARASMKGLTSVRIGLSGFGEVELVEIPIEASFLVGRGGVQNPPSLAELVGLA